jgi:cyclic dehypoxanthinyl futalosine synthase
MTAAGSSGGTPGAKAIGRALAVNRYGSGPLDPGGRLRLAGVGYLNARPIVHGLLQGLGGSDLMLELARPAEVARRLFEEEADAALVPAATIAAHGGLEIASGIAVGADGPVRSVVIVGDRPVEELDTLLLDASSRTSVVLARLVAAHRRKGRALPAFSRTPAQILAEAREGTGAVLIGDEALAARGRFAYELDLAEAWKTWTGLPFVFAVWGARRGVLGERERGLLAASLEAGLAARGEIAAQWAAEHGGDAATYERYLRENLRYTLDDAALAGLREFYARAAEARLLPPCTPRIAGDAASTSVALPSIDALLDAAAGGARLSFDDALRLAEEAPTVDLGLAADARRRALHPEGVVTYIVDRNVNYTNACTIACRFCAFYRPVGHEEVYVLSRDVLRQKIEEVVAAGGIQVLLQGGIHPGLRLSWYEDLFRWWKSEFPNVALHALSPEEIWGLARIETAAGEPATIEDVLRRLMAAGMDSLPGGGAEVLTDRVRRQIAKAKCTSAEWLECMRVAHRLGLRTTATMMYGTTDTVVDRLAHLFKVRDLQDETGGFTAFICWDYQHDHGVKQAAGETGTALYLRMQALARLVLDNVRSIQSSWVTQGPGVGQLALRYGANDLGSTMFEENVVSSAGTTFAMDAAQIERHAHAAGFAVARRNMRYEWLTEPA